MRPKVSVIIPVYNASTYLASCLDTVVLQTLQDIEVICVDDGSTDDSLNILNTYAMFDDRVKVVHQENMGTGAARNKGLQEAKGEFLSFLDADDFFVPTMLEVLYSRAIEEQSDVVVCGYLIFDEQQQLDINEIKPETPVLCGAPTEFGDALFNLPGSVWNKLFRRDLIVENNLRFDLWPVYSDISFMCNALLSAEKISVLQECFVHYRLNVNKEKSIVKTDRPDVVSYVLNNIWNHLKKLNLKDIYLQPFLGYIRKMLNNHLALCNEFQKEMFLVTLQSYMEPEIYETFFGTTPVKVSVIIPVYNAEKYLPQCLDSLIYQSLSEIEIICVNDGSTDNSLAILQEYATKDNRIKILNQKNQKQSIARANAMEIATGEYIQFVDSDDWVSETCCQCLWLYSKIKNTDMLSFGCTCVEEEKQKVVSDPYYNFAYLPSDFQDVFKPYDVPDIMVQMAVTAWMTFYKHSFLKTNKLTWLRKSLFYEDTYFFTKAVLKADRVAVLRNKFYFRRYHSQCTVRQVRNYADYHKVIYLTLKHLYTHEPKSLLSIFVNYYTTKLLNIYNILEEDQKNFFAKNSYKLTKKIYKNFHMHPNQALEQVVENYVRKELPFKKKLLFKCYKLLTILNDSHLSIPLLELNRSPFCLKILGIPLIAVKRGRIDWDKMLFRPFPFEKVCVFNLPIWNRYPRNMKQREANVALGPINSSNKVLMVELNQCHGECLAGFVRYFMDLGYGVDVLLNEYQKKEKPLAMFDHLNIYYLSDEAIIDYLNSKQLKRYDICFLNSNFLYRYHCLLFDLIRIRPKKLKILYINHHLEHLKRSGKNTRCIVLKKFNNSKKVFEVIPHYFGKVKEHAKNEITNFVVVGNIDNKRRNYTLLTSVVEKLIHSGVTNFKITIVGIGELKNISDEIQSYLDIKGRLSYREMWNEVQRADYLLTLLDPNSPEHDRYIKLGASGSFSLVYGFNIPCLIADKFAKVYSFTNDNSIVYNTNEDLMEAMLKAINMPEQEYIQLKENLKEMTKRIYQTSLTNLENAIKK